MLQKNPLRWISTDQSERVMDKSDGSLTPDTCIQFMSNPTSLKEKSCFQCKIIQCFEVLQIDDLYLHKEFMETIITHK